MTLYPLSLWEIDTGSPVTSAALLSPSKMDKLYLERKRGGNFYSWHWTVPDNTVLGLDQAPSAPITTYNTDTEFLGFNGTGTRTCAWPWQMAEGSDSISLTAFVAVPTTISDIYIKATVEDMVVSGASGIFGGYRKVTATASAPRGRWNYLRDRGPYNIGRVELVTKSGASFPADRRFAIRLQAKIQDLEDWRSTESIDAEVFLYAMTIVDYRRPVPQDSGA